MNEEIRSVHQELLASNEELQSLNQELNTANTQLQTRLAELEARTYDLNNLLNSSDVATLLLDRELCVRWFTPGMKALLDLRSADIGRPVSHVVPKFEGGELVEDAKRLLASLTPVEDEVVTREGRWFLRRLVPYRSSADRIEGVVINFIDITRCKRREEELAVAKSFAESVVNTIHEPLLVLTSDLKVKSANRTYCEFFGVGRDETEGRSFFELGGGQWDVPDLRRLLQEVLPSDLHMHAFVVERAFPGLGDRSLLLNVRHLHDAPELLLAIEDVTSRKNAEAAQRTSEERLRRILETEAVAVMFFDAEGALVDANEVFLRTTGFTRADVEARELTWFKLTPPEWVEQTERQMGQLKATGRIGPYEKEYLTKDGTRLWMLIAGRDLGDGTLVKVGIDMSARKRAEREREMLARELSHRVKNMLAVVQALVRLSDGKPQSAEEFRTTFLGRLQAMSAAHNLLLDAEWRGADVKDLVHQAVDAYRVDRPEAVEIEGEAVPLTPKQSLGLALILHELGTNAAKYGSLLDHNGRLHVGWQVETVDGAREVRLRWQERGGPEVHPPDKTGFGMRLIEGTAGYDLGGRVELDYAPEGLTCNLIFPLGEG